MSAREEKFTAVEWETAADEITGLLSRRAADIARKAADDFYERLLTTTQDYIAENARFNLESQLETANRGWRTQSARAEAAERRVGELLAALQGMINAYWRGSEDSDDKHAPTMVKAALAAISSATQKGG